MSFNSSCFNERTTRFGEIVKGYAGRLVRQELIVSGTHLVDSVVGQKAGGKHRQNYYVQTPFNRSHVKYPRC